jgi:allantoate deiminase
VNPVAQTFNPIATSRAAEVIERCQTLARFSEDPSSLRRTFLSPPMRDCHKAIGEWLERLDITATIDAAGNLRAVYPARDSGAPRLLLGSHLDTVPNAGAFDGPLGVLLAIALLEQLEGQRLPFAIELVAFSEEEGVRFSTPFIGSCALAGNYDEDFLNRRDAGGISIREAIRNFGLDPAQLSAAQLRDDVLAYVEFHIEQGPVLETLNLPLAAVEAIVGQSRLAITFTGKANHAGTTPMNARRDALAAAAEWMVAVENESSRTAGLVATVGSIQAHPGATNVIPGEVRLTLDVRHKSDQVRMQATQRLTAMAQQIAARRALMLTSATFLNHPAVAMDSFLIAQVEAAIRAAGCPPYRMPSGAGHDAMILASRVPAAMIFLRSPGGISHDPAESVLLEDVACAIECGGHLLKQLAASSEFLQSAASPTSAQRTNAPRG